MATDKSRSSKYWTKLSSFGVNDLAFVNIKLTFDGFFSADVFDSEITIDDKSETSSTLFNSSLIDDVVMLLWSSPFVVFDRI